jgi:hypothetical protein
MNPKRTGIRVADLLGSVLCLLLTASCSTAAPNATTTNMNTNAIYHVGTKDYEAKVKGFKVQLDDAKNRVADFIRNQRGDSATSEKVAIGKHSIMVGDAYHFYNPAKTGGIPLTGYYVDGNTGKVEFKKVEGSVPYPYQK